MKEILIHAGYTHSTAVILNKGELEYVLTEQTDAQGGVGNIYRGSVDNVVQGMQAAFVDISLDKNAFLFAGDICDGQDIKKLVKKGDELIVQIIKEAQGVKGARVTTEITIPGHNLVLMPKSDYVGVSKKITQEDERKRLKETVEELKNKNYGYIVRTEAQNATKEQLQNEIAYLEDEWEKIVKKTGKGILYREDGLLLTVLRDYLDSSIDKIVINDLKTFEDAKKIASVLAPFAQEKIVLKEGNLFLEAGVESKLAKLMQRKVWLDNGAYLVIDCTEALTVIDVNTGKFTGDYDLNKTIVKTNILAAKEIARQLRLRAIGGIIVVDFIDMESDEDRQAVLNALEEASRGDKIKTNIIGFAPLGLVELTRKKTRLSLMQSLQQTCPYCEGDGRILSENTIINNILQELDRVWRASGGDKAVLRVNPHILKRLKEKEGLLKEKFDGISIFVREDAQMHIEDYNVAFVLDNFSNLEGLVKLL